MAAPLPRHRFTAAEYEMMGKVGILGEDDRVELIGGEIVEMSPIGETHVRAVTRLTRLLSQVVGETYYVSVQNPIRLADYDEPQPDLAVVRGDGGTATAADVLLVIEVADSTRDFDRGEKLPRYAAAGIPEAWLADLSSGILERHSEPRDGLYRQVSLGRPGERLSSTVLPDLAIPVSLALGQPGE
jgi:Uma2 family endonuclease